MSLVGFESTKVKFHQVLIISALNAKVIRQFIARVRREKAVHNYLVILTASDAADHYDFYNFLGYVQGLKTSVVLAGSEYPQHGRVHYTIVGHGSDPWLVVPESGESFWVNAQDTDPAVLEAKMKEWRERQRPRNARPDGPHYRIKSVELTHAYQVLGFDKWPVDMEILRNKYRQLARTHHPDKGGDPNKFMEIVQAYEFIQASL